MPSELIFLLVCEVHIFRCYSVSNSCYNDYQYHSHRPLQYAGMLVYLFKSDSFYNGDRKVRFL